MAESATSAVWLNMSATAYATALMHIDKEKQADQGLAPRQTLDTSPGPTSRHQRTVAAGRLVFERIAPGLLDNVLNLQHFLPIINPSCAVRCL